MDQITCPDAINFLLALLAIGVAWFAGGRAGARVTVAYQQSRSKERKKSLLTALLQDTVRAQRFFALNKEQASSSFPTFIRFPIKSSEDLLLSGDLDVEAHKKLVEMVGKYLDGAYAINSQIAMYEVALAGSHDRGKVVPRVLELHSNDLQEDFNKLKETLETALG